MRRCRDASGLLLLFASSLLGSGCTGMAPQLASSRSVPDSQLPAAWQADTKPFTDLRISRPQSTAIPGTKDPMVLQAAAVTPPPGNPSDAAGPPLTSQETTSTSGDNSRSRLRLLYRAAAQNYASVDSYIVRLRRREQVNGRDKPEEVLQLKFRKQPFSVHLKWLGEVSAGREVVYVKGQHEDKLHTLLAAGDMPLMPAGKRIALAPDSVFVRSASRHSIYETGFGTMIERLGATIEAIEKGDPRNGTLRYVGSVKRPEFETACEEVELSIPSGCDPQLPRGGKRLAFFDMISKFPNLVITLDETGHEVEYYCFDRLEYPVRLDDDDFDPDKLWSPRKPPAPQPDLGIPGRVEPR